MHPFLGALIATLLLLSSAQARAWEPPSYDERMMIEHAMSDCNRVRVTPDPFLLLDLLRMEGLLGVPWHHRGMILAAACKESGFNPNAEGDHRFSKTNTPKAIGIVQMWPWWTREPPYGYGVNRRDPRQAGEAWLTHIGIDHLKQGRVCGYPEGGDRHWTVAWVRGVRGPTSKCMRRKLNAAGHDTKGMSGTVVKRLGRKVLPKQTWRSCERCYQKPKHLSLYRKWRKTWENLGVGMILPDAYAQGRGFYGARRQRSGQSAEIQSGGWTGGTKLAQGSVALACFDL